jgi:tetrahydromethanopterin S-methyltransferase subunit B
MKFVVCLTLALLASFVVSKEVQSNDVILLTADTIYEQLEELESPTFIKL